MAASVYSGVAPSTAFGGTAQLRGGVLTGQQRPVPLACHSSHEQILCLSASKDAPGIIALGCESVVELVQLFQTSDPAFDGEISYKTLLLHTFVTGTRTTAVDFSARTGAPDRSNPARTFVELGVGCADHQLRILRCSVALANGGEESSTASSDATITPIPSTSRGTRINAMTYCRAQDFQDILAYCTDDGKVVVVKTRTQPAVDDESLVDIGPTTSYETYTIPHAFPVIDVSFHEALFKTLVTYDSTGTIRFQEWYENPEGAGAYFTLVNPRGLARTYASAHATQEEAKTGLGLRGGMEWKASDMNMFGAVSGSRWLVWDMRKTGGGRPLHVGEAFFEGADRFRWCPTNSRLFAVCSASPDAKPAIKIFSLTNQKAPRYLNVTLGTQTSVRDIAWHPTEAILYAAVGHRLLALSPD